MSAVETKICPDCAEDIKVAARVCRFCGYRFEPDDLASEDGAAVPVVAGTVDALETPSPATPRTWRRLLLYAVSALVWLLTIPPAAMALYEDESTADVVASYGGAVLTSLGIAAGIRVVYMLVRKRPFMSPWLFVIAAMLSLLAVLGQTE